MMKRSFAVLLALLLVLCLLAGCGASTNDVMAGWQDSDAADIYDEAVSESPEADDFMGFDSDMSSSSTASTVPGSAAKMIYTAELEMETTEFDAASEGLAQLVAQMNGYFESKQVTNYQYRHGNYTIRVPAENFEAFLAQAGTLCLVTSNYSASDNVSEAYYDLESRLITQKTKLERLQTLLAQAESMADIITIEEAISETELAIEQLTGSLKSYDALVDYATVHIYLSEVYKLSNVNAAPVTFGERLAAAFKNGFTSAGDFLEELVVCLAKAWVLLVVLAVAAVAVVVWIRRRRRAKKAASAAMPTFPQDASDHTEK